MGHLCSSMDTFLVITYLFRSEHNQFLYVVTCSYTILFVFYLNFEIILLFALYISYLIYFILKKIQVYVYFLDHGSEDMETLPDGTTFISAVSYIYKINDSFPRYKMYNLAKI